MCAKATTESEQDPAGDEGWSFERAGRRLPHLLWETDALVRALIDLESGDAHLSRSALGTLMQIAHSPGSTISELARVGVRTQQSVSQVVARLERLGFVERRLQDGRAIGLHITEPGLAAVLVGDRCEASEEQELSELLGAERYEQLCELLAQACAVLTEPASRR